MADIYLSFDHPNSDFAKLLKFDIERLTGLSVAYFLENDDNCEDCQFLDHATTMLLLATKHSNITVWVMENRDCPETNQSSPSFPTTIDFKQNYERGVNNLLAVVANERSWGESRCTPDGRNDNDCSRIQSVGGRSDVPSRTVCDPAQPCDEQGANLYGMLMNYFNPLELLANDFRRAQAAQPQRTRRVLIV